MTSKLSCTRRSALKGAMSIGGGLATVGGLGLADLLANGPKSAHAAQSRPESNMHYVFCYFGGGWDILLGVDPRDPVAFGAQNRRQTRIHAGYELLPGRVGISVAANGIDFGPFIPPNLVRHAERIAMVRGISMETVSHGAGRSRFLTGRQPTGQLARGSSGATWLASEWGSKEIIPNLAVNVDSYNVDQPTYATALSANQIGDLLSSLEPADGDLQANQRTLIERFLQSQSGCDSAQLSPTLRTAEISRKNAREIAEGSLRRRFDFMAQNAEMEALRDRFALGDGSGDSANHRVALASQAISGGVSRVVSMSIAGGLDTHSGNAWVSQQGPRQRMGWNAIGMLADDLASKQYKDTGDNWLDHTVIVAFSEFSRTPLLNGSSGRDHHITNGCMLVGGGLKAGVYGKSSDLGLMPQPMNLSTGLVDPENGVIPKPEHIYQTLFYHAGFQRDDADLRVGPIDAMLA